MHPSIAQRITVLDGLRARANQATAEFYQKPGVQPPPLAPLIVVHSSGNNMFTLVNRATGVVVAERFGHNNATAHARELEAQARKFNVKQFGKFLSSWTLRFGITLTVFAFFGSHM